MRILLYCIGVLALLGGSALVVATALGKLTPITGFSAGASVTTGGFIVLAAARNNYRGHWSFLTGISLTTLALAAFGGEVDTYRTEGGATGFFFGLFLAVMFLTFGLLSLSSSYKLHRCLVLLDPSSNDYEDYCI